MFSVTTTYRETDVHLEIGRGRPISWRYLGRTTTYVSRPVVDENGAIAWFKSHLQPGL